MNILAIETSSGACSAAVLQRRSGVVEVVQTYEEMRQGHAEALMAMIRQTMAEAKLEFSDIVRIAVGIGPGSFTGTRVGIAAARGLALATGAEVVGASSLRIVAEMVLAGRPDIGKSIAVAIEAGRGEIYFETFRGDASSLGAARATTLEQAVGELPSGPLLVAGSGGAALAEAARDIGVAVDLVDVRWPDAATLARLAETMERQDDLPVPLYLRAADAKPQTAGIIGRQS